MLVWGVKHMQAGHFVLGDRKQKQSTLWDETDRENKQSCLTGKNYMFCDRIRICENEQIEQKV